MFSRVVSGEYPSAIRRAARLAKTRLSRRELLASNSLLESLVFAKRAARRIAEGYSPLTTRENILIDEAKYKNYQEEYKQAVLAAIEKERMGHE